MGRKQWILAGKIGGALVLAALAIWAVWSMSAYQTRSVLLSEQHAKQAERSPEDIESACSELAGPPLVDCVARQIEASRDDRRAEYDLGAQDRMATWAFWMMLVGAGTMALTGWALYFVRGTLDATREAVRDTGEATIAMKEANEIARQANEATLRAWIFMDTMNLSEREDGEKKWWDLLLFVKNSGQSPAKHVTVKISWKVTPVPGETIDHVVDSWPEPNGSGVLAPGASTMGAAIELTWEQLSSQWISVRCQVDYIDAITGKERATSFRIVAKSILSADSQIAMRWMQVGNVDAT